MCGAAAIPYVMMAVQAGAQAQQAGTARQVAQNNVKIAAQSAAQDEHIGEMNAQAANRQANGVMGAQRATFAARGLDINSGTPSDIIDQTSFFGQQDVATARQNGRLAAWGDNVRGAGFSAQASGYQQAQGLSLLSGAGAVASKWYGSSSTGP